MSTTSPEAMITALEATGMKRWDASYLRTSHLAAVLANMELDQGDRYKHADPELIRTVCTVPPQLLREIAHWVGVADLLDV